MSAFFEQYSKLRTSHKILAVTLLSGWFFYDLYSTKVSFAQEGLKAARAQAASLEQQIREMQENNRNSASIQEELRRTEEEEASLRAKIPDTPEIELLLSSFSSAAKLSGVRIVSFKPEGEGESQGAAYSPPPPGPPAQAPSPAKGSELDGNGLASGDSAGTFYAQAHQTETPLAYPTRIRVVVTGEFSQTVSFLDRALNFGRILHVTELEMEGSQVESIGSKRILNTNVTFLAFSQRSIDLSSGREDRNISQAAPSPGFVPSTQLLVFPQNFMAGKDQKKQE